MPLWQPRSLAYNGRMELHEGAVVDVVVSSVEQFGLLVEFEGKKGLVESPNVYWDGFGAQQRMLASFRPGQQIRVKVLLVMPEQFSCSIKHVYPELDPWWDPGIYAVGAAWEGEVRLIFDFGAAIVILPNGAQVFVPGLKPSTQLNDHVNLMLTGVDAENHKLQGRQV